MDETSIHASEQAGKNPGTRIKGIADFLLILRDRWLLALLIGTKGN